MASELPRVKGVLQRNRDQLLGRENVVATGIGYKTVGGRKTDKMSIVCSVARKMPTDQLKSGQQVPQAIEDVPIDVVQTGPIRALQPPTEKFRPAPGGVSIGHFAITAGTLGCLVKKNGRIYILSNNHVLANSNDAQVGDAILQPGPYDGGRLEQDKIAELAEFVPIHIIGMPSDCPTAAGAADFLNTVARLLGSDARLQAVSIRQVDNLVDAAIARPLSDDLVKDEILQIGTLNGTASGDLGMAIRKSGRTTGLTSGEIMQVDVTVNVQYGEGRIARFTDQLMAGVMSQGGDSGSAVVDDQNRLVGLLFAGSDQSTIINRIENVFTALEISL
jgi:hypothetical protein